MPRLRANDCKQPSRGNLRSSRVSDNEYSCHLQRRVSNGFLLFESHPNLSLAAAVRTGFRRQPQDHLPITLSAPSSGRLNCTFDTAESRGPRCNIDNDARRCLGNRLIIIRGAFQRGRAKAKRRIERLSVNRVLRVMAAINRLKCRNKNPNWPRL